MCARGSCLAMGAYSLLEYEQCWGVSYRIVNLVVGGNPDRPVGPPRATFYILSRCNWKWYFLVVFLHQLLPSVVFRVYDTDKDGKISKEDLRYVSL